jgi:hypothetical protein
MPQSIFIDDVPDGLGMRIDPVKQIDLTCIFPELLCPSRKRPSSKFNISGISMNYIKLRRLAARISADGFLLEGCSQILKTVKKTVKARR